MGRRPVLEGVETPRRASGLAGRLLSGPNLPGLAARIGARLASRNGGPWRFQTTVVVAAHAHVREALSRDLDFAIAPVNAGRIADVDRSFILGMDRHAVLASERQALYRALAAVDPGPIRAEALKLAGQLIDGAAELDAIGGYARLVAANTAHRLFGITGPGDEHLFREAVRSVFGHTFLNLSGDEQVRKRAIRAATLMQEWIGADIALRRKARDPGVDMLGRLIASGDLDDEGIARTLAGMLVGSIDTTASAVGKIVAMIGRDAALMDSMSKDCADLKTMRGWCLEALRRWPHNPILLRRALRDTELGGKTVAAGDKIILWTQAAMQDESAFPDAHIMRPDRPAEAYLHFGGALHSCAGRPVNDWQIPLLVAELLKRGIASVGKIGWAGPFPDSLPVRLAP